MIPPRKLLTEPLGNPVELVRWAIKYGVIAAEDYDLWINRLEYRYRYVRLRLNAWSDANPPALREIAGLGATATATTTYPVNAGQYVASRAVDGDVATYWQVANDTGQTSSPSASATVGSATADYNPASRATDGNAGTWWSPFNGNQPGVVTLNLRRQFAAALTSGATVQWYPAALPDAVATDGWFYPIAYHVDSSPDGVAWTTRASVAGHARDGSGVSDTLAWTATDDSYWRLVITSYEANQQGALGFGQVALVEFTFALGAELRPADLVLDRGANAGPFTELIARWYSKDYRALAFEWDGSTDGVTWTTLASIDNTPNPPSIATGDYTAGAWMQFPIRVAAGESITISGHNDAGVNTTLSGVFLGGVPAPPSAPTAGNWRGTGIGSDGYLLPSWLGTDPNWTDLNRLPAGVTYSINAPYTTRFRWQIDPVVTDAETRVLQSPDVDGHRTAGIWYGSEPGSSDVVVTLTFAREYVGMLWLYVLDRDGGRRATWTVDSRSTNTPSGPLAPPGRVDYANELLGAGRSRVVTFPR